MTAAATAHEPTLGLPADDGAKPGKDDLRLWGVTSILKVLAAEGLTYWACEQAAKAAVASARSLPARIDEEGQASVTKWLRDARFRPARDQLRAMDLGSTFHQVAEEYALTGDYPTADAVAAAVEARADGMAPEHVRNEAELVSKMVARFDGWLQRFQPAYQATEVTVYHPDYGYAGTTDSFLTISGVRLIGDYKTSREPRDSKGKPKRPYAETCLQLAAYRYAQHAAVWRPRRNEYYRRRYYLLSQAEREMAVPVPEVDGGVCIYVTPERCDAFPMRCDEPVWTAFLYAMELHRWDQGLARDVVGVPLEPPALDRKGAEQ